MGPPGVGAGFAAAAGLLFTAQRAADPGAGRADVDVGDAEVGVGGADEPLGLAHVAVDDRRPHGPRSARGQPIGVIEIATADWIDGRGKGLTKASDIRYRLIRRL